jgi:F-box and WD-40 domain protein CDC4
MNTETLGGHDDIGTYSFIVCSPSVMCLKMVDKNTLLSGSKDKTMRMWDLTTGACKRIFTGTQF